MDYRIDYLARHANWIPTLARWHENEWSALNPNSTIDARIERLKTHLGCLQIPTTFVAAGGENVLGSASLIDSDMESHTELSPWLASVYVAPEYRRHGIGTALVERVVEEAFALGVTTLYLFTPDQERFYARRGWETIERTEYRRHQVSIMALNVHGR